MTGIRLHPESYPQLVRMKLFLKFFEKRRKRACFFENKAGTFCPDTRL